MCNFVKLPIKIPRKIPKNIKFTPFLGKKNRLPIKTGGGRCILPILLAALHSVIRLCINCRVAPSADPLCSRQTCLMNLVGQHCESPPICTKGSCQKVPMLLNINGLSSIPEQGTLRRTPLQIQIQLQLQYNYNYNYNYKYKWSQLNTGTGNFEAHSVTASLNWLNTAGT